VDTLFVCSATAFMILITQQYYVTGLDASISGGLLGPDVIISSPAFTQYALESVMGGFGKTFVAVALFFFAFTTLLAYYYIAETNVAYIRRTIHIPGLLLLLKIVTLGSVFYGTIRQADLAWAMGDLGVGLMAWLNIIGILILFFMGRPALRALKDYEAQRKAGVSAYTFDPRKLGIKNAKSVRPLYFGASAIGEVQRLAVNGKRRFMHGLRERRVCVNCALNVFRTG
jgi:AGCS family alanine or glycine:cation symporter